MTYGFNLAGNRKTRQNGVQTSGQDEAYSYDGLFQLKTMQRGTLSGGSITARNFAEEWTYDPAGNWTLFKRDTNGNGIWDLNQARTHNKVNEIATIAGSNANVGFDAPGNMTKMPKADDWSTHQLLTYDAWYRLVSIKQSNGTTKVADYAYDGFNLRAVKKTYNSSGVLTETRHLYYSLGWQVLEERTNGTAERQFVWGNRYLDDLVLRQKGSERLYGLHDYFNVTGIVSTTGAVQERFAYSGFGLPKFMNGSFTPQNPNVSSYGWETLFGAYRYDAETGLNHVRFRYLHSNLGRWMSRDRIDYKEGPSLYAYVANRVVNRVDPLGLGPGDSFPSLEEAIQDCADYAWPLTGETGFEWGGWILKNDEDDTYHTRHLLQKEKLRLRIGDKPTDAVAW